MTPDERIKLKIVVETQIYRQGFDGVQVRAKGFPITPEIEDYYNGEYEGSQSGLHHVIIKIVEEVK
jgi:hypothetical protein